MSKFKEILEDLDMNSDTVVLSVGLAIDLFNTGKEILEILDNGDNLTEAELLEIIEKHDNAKKNARLRLIKSIQDRQNEE